MSEKFSTNIPEESPKDKDMSRRDFLIKTSKALAGLTLASQGLIGREAFGNQQESKEQQLEGLRQKSFYEDYAKQFSGLYGDRLYTNSELLNPNFLPTLPKPNNFFKLTPKVRILHYFLRNGRELTFATAEKLGCKYHQTVLDNAHPLTNIFKDAEINIEGEKIDWLEVPEGRSGGMGREGSRYGGKTETVMVVEAFNGKLDDWVELPAQKAGYKVDVQKGFDGLVANEMTHEIQFKYFPSLFDEKDHERLTEPFKSFTTNFPYLKFKHNAQAAEFLSDVSNWIVGGKANSYYRFFNSLYYINPSAEYYKMAKIKPENDRYWYSYQVQKYAMEEVLSQKGIKNPKVIVGNLLREAENSDYKNHDDLFVSAKKYFSEDDFEKIAQIYRKIGVELLKKMKPYFSKRKGE